jgi:RNA polymerase sigma-70 factor (ECF subfamily)
MSVSLSHEEPWVGPRLAGVDSLGPRPHSTAEILSDFSASLLRLAAAYERDTDRRQDLHQEILMSVWHSLASFEGRCSVRTWVYHVAHNAAATYVARCRRDELRRTIDVDDLELAAESREEDVVAQRRCLETLASMMDQLNPLDRSLFILELDGLKPNEIADATGYTRSKVVARLDRTRAVLKKRMGDAGWRLA